MSGSNATQRKRVKQRRSRIVRELKYGITYKGNETEWRRRFNANSRHVNHFRHAFNSAKYRAKISNKEFTIKFKDLIIPELCPIMGIPLFSVKGGRIPNSASLDRVDNSKGYTPKNTRVISWLANARKGDLTVKQIENLYHYTRGEIQVRCQICDTDSDSVTLTEPCGACQEVIYDCLKGYDVTPESDDEDSEVLDEEFDEN